MKHVVVWDPSNEFWEGAVVDEPMARSLEQRGVALLPCAPEKFFDAGFSVFAKRSWGAGWPLDGGVPQATCPILIYFPGEPFRHVHWKARLVGKAGQGIPLRLAAGGGRGNLIRPVLNDMQGKRNAASVAELGEPDEHGGWTIGGETQLNAGVPGAYDFVLFGLAPGMRVAWLAATLTP